MAPELPFDIEKDDLDAWHGPGPAFVTFGETMIRDTPADNERLERTRQVWISLAGSELTLAIMLNRLGIPSAYITRAPDNPYGWMLRNIAREQGINVDHFVWADKAELMGRYLYELGRTPRAGAGWYQRKYSAASQLGAGMVDWNLALKDASFFHATGITFGLSSHSHYDRNYLLEAYLEAIQAKPANCLVGFDFNYRSTLWSMAECKQVVTPLIRDTVDVLVTTVQDMVRFYGFKWGSVNSASLEREDLPAINNNELQELMRQLIELFRLKIVALTLRYPDSHEQHRWESAAMDMDGNFFRSPAVQPMVLMDRLGGGDTWTAGFYYGLMTEPNPLKALQKGILVGDAATRLKQTQMYDLPVITRHEIQSLMRADVLGGGKHTIR